MEKNLCLLFPLVGMEWNGQSIPFGASREMVEAVMGEPGSVRGLRSYYQDIRFDFNEAGELEFIECLGGINGSFQPEIYGVQAFQMDAEELLELLRERNDGPVDDSENGYSYTFLNSSVGVYREITPEAVEEMVREMSRMDLTAFSQFNLEEENRRAHHWDTIGIGIKNYYA